MTDSPTRRGFKIFTPVVIVVIFALAIGVAETVLGLRFPELIWTAVGTGDEGFRFYRFDPRFGLWHKPDFAASFDGLTFTMNAKGLRDVEVPYDKPAGRRRVVVLGDSLSWGYGVSDGETFSDFLEQQLVDTDVINLGVAGYGNGQQLLLLRHEGLRYDPDVVILAFCAANDVEDNYLADSAEAYPIPVFYLASDELRIAPVDVTLVQRFGIWLNENSYLVSYIQKKLLHDGSPAPGMRPITRVERANHRRHAKLAGDGSGFEDLRYLAPGVPLPPSVYAKRSGLLEPTPLNHYKVELTKRILLEIATVVRQHGAEFVVVLSPFRAQFDADNVYRDNPLTVELKRFLAVEQIPIVDLLDWFTMRDTDPDRLFLDGMHYSVDGHREVATALSPVANAAVADSR